MIAYHLISCVTADHYASVVHVILAMATAALGRTVTVHRERVTRQARVFITVRALAVIGVERRRIVQITESNDNSGLVINAEFHRTVLVYGRLCLPVRQSLFTVRFSSMAVFACLSDSPWLLVKLK